VRLDRAIPGLDVRTDRSAVSLFDRLRAVIVITHLRLDRIAPALPLAVRAFTRRAPSQD